VADGGVTGAIDEAIRNAGPAKPAQTGHPQQHAAHHGRTSSWVAIAIIVIGFCIGGAALPAGPTWWLFWVGVGIVVVGGIMALSTRILDDWY
jgi:hypothetical protein